MNASQIVDRINAMEDDETTDFINVLVVEQNADLGWSKSKGRKYYRFSLFGAVGRSAQGKATALRNWARNYTREVAA